MNVNRRNFLRGATAGGAGAALTGGVLIGGAYADARGDTVATGRNDFPSTALTTRAC